MMESVGRIHVCHARECAKEFDSQEKLKSHMRKVHKIFSKRSVAAENLRYCDFTGCGWTGHKDNLIPHIREVHGVVECNPDLPVVKCAYCPREFRSHRLMVEHYIEVHDPHVSIKTVTLPSWPSFKEWCEQMRSTDCIDLVCRRGRNAKARSHTVYCSRSGLGQQIIPEQITTSMPRKSVRAGIVCVGFATATQVYSGPDNYIQVVYCANHCGHDISDCWMRLTKEEKDFVIEKLKDKRDKDYILRCISERRDLPRFSRLKYLNKADLVYYDKIYNPSRYRLSSEDVESVRQRVETDQRGIFFAFSLPEKECGEGFQLGIMTENQRKLLVAHGSKGIAFDSTHNVTRYMFKLVSAVVYDEQGRSQPVGHFICYSESERHMLPFFDHLKMCLGGITPKVLISDDCLAFINAFHTSFGPETGVQHIICTWHVVRSWNRRLALEIKDRELQKTVSKYLANLIISNDEVIVRANIAKMLSFLDDSDAEGTDSFAKYFRDNYTCPERLRKWAPCYRISEVANTNMGIERYHRTLKENYLRNKENKRLDESIECVIQCAKDRSLRNIGQERGQTFGNYRTLKNNKSHKQGMTAYRDRPDLIEEKGNDRFTVKSSADNSKFYSVTFAGQCTCPPSARCRACGVCYENYTCNCPAGTQAGVSCKHIHAVHTLLAKPLLPVQQAPSATDSRSALVTHVLPPVEQNYREDTFVLMDKLEELIDEKREEVSDMSDNAVRDLYNKLSSVLITLQPLEMREHQVGRPKRAPQQRRPLIKRVALTKSGQRKGESSPESVESSIQTCLVCFARKPGPESTHTDPSQWVECLRCDDFIHKLCYDSDLCHKCM